MVFQFFQYILALIVPGLIGALFFSIFARLTTEIDWRVALILDLFTFTTMITGLYFFNNLKHENTYPKYLNRIAMYHLRLITKSIFWRRLFLVS